MEETRDRVISIRDLNITFDTANGTVHAIRGMRLDLFRGETVAIVGESGSGKSVTAKAIMGISSKNQHIVSGSILYSYRDANNELHTMDIAKMSEREIRRKVCGRHVAMVFQDPMTSLNPTMTIGKQIMEGMLEYSSMTKAEAKQKAIDLLRDVGIEHPEQRFKQYPHQLSGGMRQRVVIAIALSCNPDVLICDEPTTALDVTIQNRILELIKNLQKQKNLSVIYITHDLGVVAQVADYVCVMYAGRVVEKGAINEIFYDPRHPYTWGLLSSMPDLSTDSKRLFAIPGNPVNLLNEIKGDAFAPRNPYALELDFEMAPPQFNVGGKHRVSSWLCHPDAPKVEMPKSLQEKIARMLERGGK